MIKRPLLIRGLGIYCPNKLEINPKLIEVLISKKEEEYSSLGNFELSLSSGTQVLTTEEFLFNDIMFIKILIKASFGGNRTYLSNVYLYEHLPWNESALPFNEYNKDKDKEKNLNFNFYHSLPSRNSDFLLSDSDLTEKKYKKNFVHNLNSYEKSNIFKIKRKNEEKDESKRIILTSQSLSNHKGFNQNYYNKDSFDKDNNNKIINGEKNPLFSSTNDNFYNSNVNNRISNLENDLNDIKLNINKILDNLNIIKPNSQRDILDECNKLIESKIQSSKNIYNLNTINTINTNNFSHEEFIPSNQSHSSKNFNKEYVQNNKIMKMEDLLDNKLDEKLNIFSKKLETKIYQTILQPSLKNLEEILQSSLNDVKEQLKNSQRKKKEKKQLKSHKKYMKTEINKNEVLSFREKELKLNDLINKLQNKLNMQYFNTVENSKIFESEENLNIKNITNN